VKRICRTFAAMKYLILLLALYFFYKFFLKQQKPLRQPQQEPDLFIDHEEVIRDHEKNK
jgi:hypothetical protein